MSEFIWDMRGWVYLFGCIALCRFIIVMSGHDERWRR